MRPWTKLLIGALVLVLVLVAGSALFISQIDPNEYRGDLADLVEDATGREFRVGGGLRIKLLPVPSIIANDVTFANPTWASQPHMVRAKRLRADVALLPLLNGRIVVHRFIAIEPQVFLETDADGRGNWQFGDEAAAGAQTGDDGGPPSAQLDILVREVRIEKAGLEYLDGKTESKTALNVDELKIGTDLPGGRVALSLRATYQDLPVTLDGRLGAAGAILRNQRIDVDLEGMLGAASFTVQGVVGEPLQGKDLRLDVALKSKSTKKITDVAGVEVEELGPVNLTLSLLERDGRYDFDDIKVTARPRNAHVTIKGSVLDVVGNPRPNLDISLSAKTLRQLDGRLPAAGPVGVSANVRPRGKIVEIRDLVAKVGKSDLSGSARLDIGGEQPSASAELQAKVIDLAELLPSADKGDTGASVETPSDGRMFPDDPLPLAALRKANGKIELSVDRLITPKLTLSKVRITAGLDNGKLTVKPAAQVAGGTVGATIDIDARMQPAKFAVDVDANKVSIGALTKEIRGYETSKGLASDFKMKLRGQGDSVRTLMAGLDGDIRLEIGEGRLKNDVLDRAGADLLTQILGVAVPTDEEDDTTILNCGVVRFRVKEGDAIADQTLVMETDRVLLKGGGIIDLKTESLDLGANLAARKGIRLGAGTLSSLVKVQGTLAEPQLGTDLTAVVKTGARVGIAVATVGLSLIVETVYGHITEDDHPCQTALARQIGATPSDYRAQRTSAEN